MGPVSEERESTAQAWGFSLLLPDCTVLLPDVTVADSNRLLNRNRLPKQASAPLPRLFEA